MAQVKGVKYQRGDIVRYIGNSTDIPMRNGAETVIYCIYPACENPYELVGAFGYSVNESEIEQVIPRNYWINNVD